MAAGRPRKFNPTKKRLEEVTDLISQGYTEASLARHLGYSPTYFCELKKQIPELAEAIKAGRENVEQLLANKLFLIAQADNNPKQLTALIFMLKSQYGWRDSGDVDTSSTQSKKKTKLKPKRIEK